MRVYNVLNLGAGWQSTRILLGVFFGALPFHPSLASVRIFDEHRSGSVSLSAQMLAGLHELQNLCSNRTSRDDMNGNPCLLRFPSKPRQMVVNVLRFPLRVSEHGGIELRQLAAARIPATAGATGRRRSMAEETLSRPYHSEIGLRGLSISEQRGMEMDAGQPTA